MKPLKFRAREEHSTRGMPTMRGHAGSGRAERLTSKCLEPPDTTEDEGGGPGGGWVRV